MVEAELRSKKNPSSPHIGFYGARSVYFCPLISQLSSLVPPHSSLFPPPSSPAPLPCSLHHNPLSCVRMSLSSRPGGNRGAIELTGCSLFRLFSSVLFFSAMCKYVDGGIRGRQKVSNQFVPMAQFSSSLVSPHDSTSSPSSGG